MVTIRHKQTLLDLAIQEYGTPTAVVGLAIANGISVTTTLNPGDVLTTPSSEVDSEILNYYTSKNIHPATAVAAVGSEGEPAPEGIEYWAIEMDFIIS